jgi:hypothetical protein
MVCMRQSFLATLSHRIGVTGLESAIFFHLCRWADELEAKFAASSNPNQEARSQGIVTMLLDQRYGEADLSSAPITSGETLTEEGDIHILLPLLKQT